MWINPEITKWTRRKYKFDNRPYGYTDPRKHRRISFIKSAVRIIGYACLPFNLIVATVVLVISEIIGIIEETV